MKPRLLRVSGHAPEQVILNSPELRIGRDLTNDLRLEDPTVSSHHCRIQRDADEFVLIDLDSTNGSFINGHPISGIAALGFGDELQIGQVRLRLERM